MKLLRNLVALKKVEANGMTEGGLHVPQEALAQLPRYIVVDVGPGTPDHPVTVKKGDLVWAGNGGVYDINLKPSETIYVTEESTILFVEEDSDRPSSLVVPGVN